MAISRAQLLKELLPGLNALFGKEYASGWAVYVEHQPHDMAYRIVKIMPWSSSEHAESMVPVLRVMDARDELEAYTKAMKMLEQTK